MESTKRYGQEYISTIREDIDRRLDDLESEIMRLEDELSELEEDRDDWKRFADERDDIIYQLRKNEK